MKTKRNKHTFSETDESSINTIKNNIEAIHMEQILFTKNDLAFFLEYGKWCGGGQIWRQLTP